MSRRRHVPRRTCIGCGTVRPKREMVRLVRRPEGPVMLDPTGKQSGRGAYICPALDCIDKALVGGRLQQRLKTTADMIDLEQLRSQLLALAEGTDSD